MRSLGFAGLAVAVLLSATLPLHAAPKEDALADRVNDAIKRGVQFLRDQGSKGNWEVDAASVASPHTKGGWSALALLSLLNCGVPADDPTIKRGLEYLRSVDTYSTYVLSLQTMVLIQAGQDGDKARIQQNVNRLLATRMRDGWTYAKPDIGVPADNSNTQYALLALHEALQAGYEVDRKAIQEIQDFYIRTQSPTGSWGYSKSSPGARMTMTTAGLCGLYITGIDLNVGLQNLRPDGSAENCGKYQENPNVAHAIAWLSGRFPSRINDTTIREQRMSPIFYDLYGIERAGRMSGQRFLGEHDWYRIGCEYLVDVQKLNGSWNGDNGGGPGDSWPVVSTSFALLFLSKGRTPVLVTKLAYGPTTKDLWNNKRNDARHLTAFASRELFKRQPMAWQVFDVRHKTADGKAARRELAAELLQSPLVYFNGHTEAPSGKEEEILAEYVENGGIIFAEACCNSELFDRNFRALMARMFPGSELKELPPEHPVWTSKFLVASGRPFRLYGISQGCKTVVIYSPQAISGYWEANQSTKGEGKTAFELGANIVAYATGLVPPKPKGAEVPIFRGDDQKADIKRGYLKVAQLMHGVDSQPAPNAMRNLMNEAHKAGLDAMLETKSISPTVEEAVMSYRFFYMHGRREFKSNTTDDLKALRFKLEYGGGLLLADACCGSTAFDESFQKFIGELFDHKAKLEEIPKDDVLFGKTLNGEPLDEDHIRCRKQAGKPYSSAAPALQGIKFEGRWIVIYSKYDLGCALENKTSPDCLGYDHDSAVKLGRAAVLYHLTR